jgi:hypothetical protein
MKSPGRMIDLRIPNGMPNNRLQPTSGAFFFGAGVASGNGLVEKGKVGINLAAGDLQR